MQHPRVIYGLFIYCSYKLLTSGLHSSADFGIVDKGLLTYINLNTQSLINCSWRESKSISGCNRLWICHYFCELNKKYRKYPHVGWLRKSIQYSKQIRKQPQCATPLELPVIWRLQILKLWILARKPRSILAYRIRFLHMVATDLQCISFEIS